MGEDLRGEWGSGDPRQVGHLEPGQGPIRRGAVGQRLGGRELRWGTGPLARHLGSVLTRIRGQAERGKRGALGEHEAPRKPEAVDLIPEVTSRELRAVEHITQGVDRAHQQRILQAAFDHLGFRLSQAEGGDVLHQLLDDADTLLAALQEQGEVHPVLVQHVVVAEALGVHPGQEPLHHRPDHRPEGDGDDHVTVLAWVDRAQHQVAEAHPARFPLHLFEARRGVEDGRQGGLADGLLRRQIDVLAAAAAGTMLQRHGRRDGGLRAGMQPGLGNADAHRRAVAVAGHRQLAAGGEQRQIRGAPADFRAGLAPRCDVHCDELRIGLSQRIQIDVEWRRVVVEHYVRGGCQSGHLIGVGRCHGALAAVVGVMRVSPWPTARRFHHHHIGAELGQQVAREPAALVCQIQHPIRTKHPAPDLLTVRRPLFRRSVARTLLSPRPPAR